MPTIAFDIELATRFPIIGKLNFDEMAVSCAAIASSSGRAKCYPSAIPEQGAPDRLSPQEIRDIIDDLYKAHCAKAAIVSFNGLGFDWRVLASASKSKEHFRLCAEMAMNHYDIMFYALCVLGHPIGLAKVAEGFNLPGKSEGMTGAIAVPMWAGGATEPEALYVKDTFEVSCGSSEAQEIVLRYVERDALVTLSVWKAIEDEKIIKWITRRGSLNCLEVKDGIPPVRECLKIPAPDTSWMDNPISRMDLISWVPLDVLERYAPSVD